MGPIAKYQKLAMGLAMGLGYGGQTSGIIPSAGTSPPKHSSKNWQGLQAAPSEAGQSPAKPSRNSGDLDCEQEVAKTGGGSLN